MSHPLQPVAFPIPLRTGLQVSLIDAGLQTSLGAPKDWLKGLQWRNGTHQHSAEVRFVL